MKITNRGMIRTKRIGFKIPVGIAFIVLILGQAVSSFGALVKETFYDSSISGDTTLISIDR